MRRRKMLISRPKKVILDLDEVVVDMMSEVVLRYNEIYKSDLTLEDITEWKLPQDMKDIYEKDFTFFRYLNPIPGAIEGIKILMKYYDIIIATSHSQLPFIAYEKVKWVRYFLPELSGSMMIGPRKDVLQGEYIIDDCYDYLVSSPCNQKLIMDRPWNRKPFPNNYEYTRIYTWDDILFLLLPDEHKHRLFLEGTWIK